MIQEHGLVMLLLGQVDMKMTQTLPADTQAGHHHRVQFECASNTSSCTRNPALHVRGPVMSLSIARRPQGVRDRELPHFLERHGGL